MRCYIHEFQDAIRNCESCGQPICNDCIEERNGKFYCPNCTDSGWLESDSTLSSSGSEKQYPDAIVDSKPRSDLFILGGIGALIGIVGSSLSALQTILITGGSVDYFFLGILAYGAPLISYFAGLLIAIGFYGFYVNYENEAGRWAAFLGIAAIIFRALFLIITPTLYGRHSTSFEMQQVDMFSLAITGLLVGGVTTVSTILEIIALYQVKDFVGNANLVIIIILLMFAPIVLLFWGLIIIPFTNLLLAILFFQAKMPETEEWLRRPKSKSNYDW